jgi:choline dehydrogenase
MDTFDDIVVGGGTAGSVIAARLSQDPGMSVLVLEAGAAQPSAGMASPLAWPSLTRTSVDWGDERAAPTAPFTRGRGGKCWADPAA